MGTQSTWEFKFKRYRKMLKIAIVILSVLASLTSAKEETELLNGRYVWWRNFKWPNWYAYEQANKIGNVRGWKGKPGPQGMFMLHRQSDGSYLITTKKWPNWFVYMTSGKKGNVRGWKGNPGVQGRWVIRGTGIYRTYTLSPQKWRNWCAYMQNDSKANIQGWKCKSVGKAGYWRFYYS